MKKETKDKIKDLTIEYSAPVLLAVTTGIYAAYVYANHRSYVKYLETTTNRMGRALDEVTSAIIQAATK